MSSTFDFQNSNIALALDVSFPSNVFAGPGVGITKAGPIWTVGLDTLSLPSSPAPLPPLADLLVAVYDTSDSRYEQLRLDTLISTATGLDTRTPIGDAAYSVTTSDRYVALNAALTSNRTVTLPLANSVPGGREILLQDEVGGLSPAHAWLIQAQGTDTLDGKTSRLVSAPYGGLRLRSDGSGKWSAMTADFVTPISLSYQATTNDRVIVVTAMTGAITVTLPVSSQYQAGQRLLVVDQGGQCSATNTITVAPTTGDLINGLAAPAQAVLNGPHLYIGLVSNGSGAWTIVDGGATGSISVTSSQITDASPLGRQLLTQTTASADRASLGSGAVGDTLFQSATQANAQATLGLGSAATAVIGTSGAAVPLLNGNNTWSGTDTFSSSLTAGADEYLTGVITPATLAANVNDYAPSGFATASVLRLQSSASVSITGLAGGAAGRHVSLINVGSNPIALVNQSVSSAAANRFNLGANVTLAAGQAATLWYDATLSMWDGLAAPGSGTGTAGALLSANNLSDVASVPTSRTNLGLSTMATQAATAVAITGGTVNATTIGATTPAAVTATALTATGAVSVNNLNGGQLAGLRNRIINGDMRIDQRNNHAVITLPASAAVTYLGDRWAYYQSVATGRFQGSLYPAAVPGSGSAHFLSMSSGSGTYTPAASEEWVAFYRFEGQDMADLQWGTASALPVTLSFLAAASTAGTYSGALQLGTGSSQSFVFTFAATTGWTKFAIPISGCTVGTWPTDNTAFAQLVFDLGCGNTLRSSTVGSWIASPNICGAVGSVQLVALASATLQIADVQLELGSVATPFERRPIGLELALCQRYYQRYTSATANYIQIRGYQAAGGVIGNLMLIPRMRVAPTVSVIGTWTLANISSGPLFYPDTSTVLLQATLTAVGDGYCFAPANGGFDLSAEL